MLAKKLATGTVISAWNYGNDKDNSMGQAIGIKTGDGIFDTVVNVESAKDNNGTTNRVIIKRKFLEQNGWTVIEE